MEKKLFSKLIKESDPQKLLNEYMENKIFLTDKQLDRVFRERNSKPSSTPKGTCVRYAR